MSSDIAHVYAAAPLIAGSLRVAPKGTVGPVDALVALDAAFVDLGYIGDGGFTEKNDRVTSKKRAFGGRVVKVTQSEFNVTLQLVLLESLRAEALKAVYGAANVQVIPANSEHGNQVTVHKNGIKLPHLAWVMDTADEELTAKYRSFIPDGQVTTTGDIKVVHTDTIEYSITIECFEDAAGDNILTFTDDGQVGGS